MSLIASRAIHLLALLGLAGFIACTTARSDADDDDDDTSGQGAGGPGGPGGTGGSGGSGGSIFTTGSGTGGSTGDGCSDAAKLVYVLSSDNDLYSFEPDQKKFTLIGPLSCPTGMQPNSMAVDRNATAYINYVEGGSSGDTAGVLFKVSTTDASCEGAPTVSLPPDWFRMGMGFSTDGAGQSSETFFVTGTAFDGSGPGLGRIDLGTNTLAPVGEFTGSLNGANAELTGTGDGRLFGFFTTTPVQVAEIDKASGAIVSAVPLPGVETPSFWAFSFWGGDFYLYTAPSQFQEPNRTTNVTRYRPSDGSIDTAYMTNIGFRIVGAGVSTCAPLEPPE